MSVTLFFSKKARTPPGDKERRYNFARLYRQVAYEFANQQFGWREIDPYWCWCNESRWLENAFKFKGTRLIVKTVSARLFWPKRKLESFIKWIALSLYHVLVRWLSSCQRLAYMHCSTFFVITFGWMARHARLRSEFAEIILIRPNDSPTQMNGYVFNFVM